MSLRNEHKFTFEGKAIAEAAQAESDYHADRIGHWQARADKALEVVRDTIGAKVVEQNVTGGKQASIDIDYGDREAWAEYTLAYRKVAMHTEDRDRFEQDAVTYGSQPGVYFELDRDDVRWFRLGGDPRED